MHAMASTTWPWMLMVKIVRSSSTSALVNPIFKFTRLSHCWMRLETSYINQQKVSDTRSSRLLTCGAAYWKPSGPETGDIAANNRSREDGQREQTRSRRSKPPTRSRTPWLDTGRQLLIWEGYKRNHKGSIPPIKTRIRCTRGPDKVCGNPCPICRNRIKVHFRDVDLLKQFICPHTGQILEPKRTGLCRQQQKRIEAAIEKAWDHGLIPFTVPRQMPEDHLRTPPWNKIDVR